MADSRRVKMTKRMIHEAFLSLLQHNPIGKITVTQVCEAADVNRSTFYSYYNSVYDLLREIEDDVLSKIPRPTKAFTAASKKEFLELLIPFFEYIKKHGTTFSVLISASSESSFHHRLAQVLFDALLYQDIIKDSFFARLGYVFSINGVIGMVKEWIDNDFPIDTRQFAKMAFDISYHANEVVYHEAQKGKNM